MQQGKTIKMIGFVWFMSFVIGIALLHRYNQYARLVHEACIANDHHYEYNWKSTIGDAKPDDVIFTVKTSKPSHHDRVMLILDTWGKGIEKQVHIITDEKDPEIFMKTGYQLISTECGKSHNLYDLCCKTDAEFTSVLERNNETYKWWCHVDDDTYVNIPRLLHVLNQHNSADPVYIGKKSRPFIDSNYKGVYYPDIVFGTGGAGYCITRQVVERMVDWIGNGKFVRTCVDANLADDCSIGFIVTNRLKVPMTESQLFHSHQEQMRNMKPEDLTKQATLSYNLKGKTKNVISIPANLSAFDENEDPTRIRSVHCLIFPNAEICPERKKSD